MPSAASQYLPQFTRYYGIDYSGAANPESSLSGIRLYAAAAAPTRSQKLPSPPLEILPPKGPRKYWSRQGLAHFLAEHLASGPPTLVGIDHGFSFPAQYFEAFGIPRDWSRFLDDFAHHWPTNQESISVELVRKGDAGDGVSRTGESRWRRMAETRCQAKSVFHFDVQGSVAKSTHAGLPWLRYLRRELGLRLHFWPFDGWSPPSGCSVIAEIYPALFSKSYPQEDRNPHQHDAYSVARWMQESDRQGRLIEAFSPPEDPLEIATASIEGWILGLGTDRDSGFTKNKP